MSGWGDVPATGKGNFGVDIGRLTEYSNNGQMWHSCEKVCEAIELSRGMISGVGPRIGVLYGDLYHIWGREVFIGGVMRSFALH